MKSIKTKIVLLTTLSIIITTFVIGGFSAYQLFASNQSQLSVLKTEMLKGYDNAIKYATESITTQI